MMVAASWVGCGAEVQNPEVASDQDVVAQAPAGDLSSLSDADLEKRAVAYGHWLTATGAHVNQVSLDGKFAQVSKALKTLFPKVLGKSNDDKDLVYEGLFRAATGELVSSANGHGNVTRIDGSRVPTLVGMWRAALFYTPTYLDTKTGAMYLGDIARNDISGPLAPPANLAITGNFNDQQVALIEKALASTVR